MSLTDQLRGIRERVVREHMDSENRLDFAATLATFSHPRYELMATGEVFDGAEAVMGYYSALRTAVPDQRNEVRAIRHADDAVIVEFDLFGTNTGPLRGLPPTGRAFRCPMIALFIFDAERIECERIYFDSATILRQLGMAPDPLPEKRT